MAETPPTAARPFPWFSAFLVVATVGLSVLVFVLSNENRRLKGLLEDKYAAAIEHSIHAGDTVDPIELVSATGASTKHEFGAHAATLVLVISTQCPYCEEVMPTWVRAIEDAKASGVAVVCIESDVIAAEKLKGTPTGIPAYFVPNARSSWLTRLSTVPAALLVGPEGKVAGTWYGPLTAKEREGMTDALMGAAAGALKK